MVKIRNRSNKKKSQEKKNCTHTPTGRREIAYMDGWMDGWTVESLKINK